MFVEQPQFQGQTKEKLVSVEANKLVETIVGDNFEHWLTGDKEAGNVLLEPGDSMAALPWVAGLALGLWAIGSCNTVAETGRQPVDNPDTHLELTHGARARSAATLSIRAPRSRNRRSMRSYPRSICPAFITPMRVESVIASS